MSVEEITTKILSVGKQTITHSSQLHRELNNLSAYEFSKVNDNLNKHGLTIEWLIIEDEYLVS